MSSAFRLKENATDPTTPTSGELKIYAKTDKVAYVRFDDGSIQVLTGTASMTSLTGDVTGTGPGATATTISAGAVDNAKVSASAAIAQSKLAALTANRVNVTDGSGFITASATTATELGYLSGVTSAIQGQIDGKQPLDSDLTALAGLSSTGIIARTGSGTAATRTITAGTGISIADGDGVAANPTISTTITQYTDELAQDAVGGSLADSATVDFTYNDVGNSITADVIQSGIDHGSISGLGDDDHTQYHTDARALTWLGTRSTADLPEGSNLYFSDERAQDAVGSILADSSKIDFTYNDPGNSITATIVAGSLVDADISASAAIAYSKLNLALSIVNADISAIAAIAYSKLNLALSIVNADISATAAIAYSKLNLALSIVNADISASAAIAYSKLAALTASRALVSDGSGFVSVSSVTTTELGYVSGVTSAIQTQINTKVNRSGDTMTGAFIESVVALTDAATIAVDASLGNTFTVTLGGNRTLGAPTNPTNGQKITFRIRQDGTGSRTLAFNAIYRFGADITAMVASTGANKTDYIGCIYNSADTKWDVVAVSKGF